MDCSPPGSSVLGISQIRILEWVAVPFSRSSSWPRDRALISCIAGRFFTAEPSGKPIYSQAFSYKEKNLLDSLLEVWDTVTNNDKDDTLLLTFGNVRGEKFKKRIKWWWKMGNQRGQLFICLCMYLFIFTFWPCHEVCGIFILSPGMAPVLPAVEAGILTAGLPGRSQEKNYLDRVSSLLRWHLENPSVLHR